MKSQHDTVSFENSTTMLNLLIDIQQANGYWGLLNSVDEHLWPIPYTTHSAKELPLSGDGTGKVC